MAQTQTKSKSKEIKDVSGISSKVENSVKKIVIRRLPPSLTKEQFLEIVSPLPEYDYFCYANADLRYRIISGRELFFECLKIGFKNKL